jgi:hypothetical protein
VDHFRYHLELISAQAPAGDPRSQHEGVFEAVVVDTGQTELADAQRAAIGAVKILPGDRTHSDNRIDYFSGGLTFGKELL